jgi:hypothetical protein
VPNQQYVQDPAADALLDANPFALLVGMLLDQQSTMATIKTQPLSLVKG